MFSYVIRRSAQTVAFLFVASFLLYSLLVFWIPRGPYAQYQAAMWEKAASADDGTGSQVSRVPGGQRGPGIEQMAREYYKVDRAWPLSYFLWLFDPQDTRLNEQGEEVPVDTGLDLKIGPLSIKGSGVLTGDLSKSTRIEVNGDVAEIIGQRWGTSAWLVLSSMLLSVLVAVPLGVLGAARRNTGLDNALTVGSFVGLSMPTFLLGLLLIIFLAVLPSLWHHVDGWTWLPYFPPGAITSLDRENDPVNYLYHLVLPATALSAVQIGVISRYVRFSMLEVLGEDYIRTAFAKGVARRRVVLKHALKNALLPLITTIALALPSILSALILVESVFAYPGLGRLFYLSSGGTFTAMQSLDISPDLKLVSFMDVPLALALFMLMIIVVAVANTVADLLYAAADPRVSFGSNRTR